MRNVKLLNFLSWATSQIGFVMAEPFWFEIPNSCLLVDVSFGRITVIYWNVDTSFMHFGTAKNGRIKLWRRWNESFSFNENVQFFLKVKKTSWILSSFECHQTQFSIILIFFNFRPKNGTWEIPSTKLFLKLNKLQNVDWNCL